MRIWILVTAFSLLGCSHIDNYQQVPKVAAPVKLQGIWQTIGPQKGLVSPAARATLIIDKQGNTLDCREWQRVITKSGKLIRIKQQIENLNQTLRHRPLVLQGEVLYYDKLALQRTQKISEGCRQAAQQLAESSH